MKTSEQTRLVRLSGLLLLSLLVVALAVQVAQAAGSSTNTLQLPTLEQVRQDHGDGAGAGAGTITEPPAGRRPEAARRGGRGLGACDGARPVRRAGAA